MTNPEKCMILTWLLLDLTPSLEYVVFRVYVYIAFLVNAEYCMCYGITRRSFSGSHEFLWKMPLISYSTQVEWLFFFIFNWYHFQILVIKNIFFNLVLLLQKNKLRKNSKKNWWWPYVQCVTLSSLYIDWESLKKVGCKLQ